MPTLPVRAVSASRARRGARSVPRPGSETSRSRPRLGRTARPPREPEDRSTIRALTSDLWYTLLYHHLADQHRLEKARWKVWTDPLVRGGLSREDARSAVGRVQAWAHEREARGHCPSVPHQVARLSRDCRVRLDGDDIARQLDRLIANARVLVAPGAPEALDRLRSAGVRLGLVSNLLHGTGDGCRALLRSFRILAPFSVLVFSDEHPWSKPGPQPFRYAVRQLGAGPAQSAHVGDLAYDIVGARRAGLRPILYTGLHRLEPGHLRELAHVADARVERCATWANVADRVLATD